MRQKTKTIALLLVVILSSLPNIVFAQADQTGEIAIEGEERQRDPYPESQDKAIAYFRALAELTARLSKGEVARPEPIGEEIMFYLTGAYLYCAVNSGTCPTILDGILEVDIINSRLDGKASCPHMKRFWNQWVRNALEERHKYLVKTSFINEHSKFNSETRPKYLKCEATIESVLHGIPSSQQFFRDRYRNKSSQAELGTRVTQLLEQLKAKVPNVFIAVGAQGAAAAQGSEGSKPKGAKATTKKRTTSRGQ